MARPSAASIADDEIAQFSRHAEDWWNPDGAFKPLHRLNPVRMGYIRDQACSHFKRDPQARHSFKNLKILDVGCGGGLLSEPMARLGAQVTGLDASRESIAIARAHAKTAGLAIDYREGSVEELAEQLLPSSFRKTFSSARETGRKKVDPESRLVSFGEKNKRDSGFAPKGAPRNDAGFDIITALEIVEHVADIEAFIKPLASLLKPNGLMIVSTLNRTPKSFLLGIVAAEYILGWVPRGTHQWGKFIRPSELARHLERSGVRTTDITGLIFNPLRGAFELSATDLDVNYLLTAKPN